MEIEIKNRKYQMIVKLTDAEKEIFQRKAKEYNFRNVSDYVRCMCLNGELEVKLKKDERK